MAVARVVLEEISEQGRTFKWVQARSGVKPRAWGYYFKGDRPIPFPALEAVAGVLGVPASELIRRAEESLAQNADPAAELLEGLPAHVLKGTETYRRPPKPEADGGSSERPTGTVHSA